MSDRLSRRILDHISHREYEPTRARALAAELGVEAEDVPAFQEALSRLVESGQVVGGSTDTVALPPMGREVTGTFRRHERGFGFLIPDRPNAHGDLFVPAPDTGGALTGDRVRVSVRHRNAKFGPSGHSPYIGRVEAVVQRGRNRYTGVLTKRGKGDYIVEPDGRSMTDPIVVRDALSKGARVGDKVVVELTKFPEGNFLPEGVITDVLGAHGEPDVETEAVIHSFGLPGPFPEPVMDDARRVVARFNEDPASFLADRLDLRSEFILTIDPPDAKDFDDAISLSHTEKGIELGVHIADVAAFVTPGSAMDVEASSRGNSCYLPRRVIPMLPELLSNGVCSLQPRVDRLTRSAFITYDGEGRVVSTRFARSVIRSSHRLTYLEAQALIDGDEAEARKYSKSDDDYTPRLIASLREMDALSKRIRARRMRDGMIVLDLPEVELVYDEGGRVIDAVPEDDAYTHKLIEAFMVEANESVARVFADLAVPLIRRVHPEPGAKDISELRVFAKVAGQSVPANPTRKELQALLERVRGTPAARPVHFAVLRTLTKAEYAPDLIGHFALASEHYTHFTSPIRRYPDLVVHRAFDALRAELGDRKSVPRDPRQRKILGNRLRENPLILDETELRKMGRDCSSTERKAEAAERELRNLLVMQLLEKHVGEEFPGTVTGVSGFGLFVQIDKYLVEGGVKMQDLPGAPAERWVLQAGTGTVVAKRSGRRITIGDSLRVRINRVDTARRVMDLLIVEGNGATKPKPRHEFVQPPKRGGGGKSKPHGKRGKSGQRSRKSRGSRD